MARALLKLATILSLVFSILLQASSSQMTLSSDIEDDDEEYVLDSPPENFRSRSRFLASVVRKGTRCNAERGNVCNGVSANKGTSLIYCCKKHCRNVLGDKNNCGICGNKCRFAESCCNGRCTNIFSNVNHCGKCTKEVCSGGRDVIMEHVGTSSYGFGSIFSCFIFTKGVSGCMFCT
ncbi:hypothetical protein OIU77_015790 [Salix suchowensis]|uniref:Stigma-specific Stig1 family protein n=1 Tax=Salix suchowensis TaxID=1278906 RepID=A0ABQ8ZIE1_9ROSI|nr:hypothetical protein OIU77_015790 [Salix suchowensis]